MKLDIYDKAIYSPKADVIDAHYERCDRCTSFPHTCMYYMYEANTSEGYEGVAWCRCKRKEGTK